MYDLKENDLIYHDKLKIVKYISEGFQAKIYLGHIDEIDKPVTVKRYILKEYNHNIASNLPTTVEILRSMKHERICRYYDVNYVKQFKVRDFHKLKS